MSMKNGLKAFTLAASMLAGTTMANAQQTPVGGVVIDGRHVPGGTLNGRPVLSPDSPGNRSPAFDPVRLAWLREAQTRDDAIKHWNNAQNATEPATIVFEALMAIQSFRNMQSTLAQESEIFRGDRKFLATAASRFIRDEIESITADLLILDGWDERDIRDKLAKALPNAVLVMEFGKGRSIEEAKKGISSPELIKQGLKDAGATPDQIKPYEAAVAAVKAVLSQPAATRPLGSVQDRLLLIDSQP
jgi:hypothetical protein